MLLFPFQTRQKKCALKNKGLRSPSKKGAVTFAHQKRTLEWPHGRNRVRSNRNFRKITSKYPAAFNVKPLGCPGKRGKYRSIHSRFLRCLARARADQQKIPRYFVVEGTLMGKCQWEAQGLPTACRFSLGMGFEANKALWTLESGACSCPTSFLLKAFTSSTGPDTA